MSTETVVGRTFLDVADVMKSQVNTAVIEAVREQVPGIEEDKLRIVVDTVSRAFDGAKNTGLDALTRTFRQ